MSAALDRRLTSLERTGGGREELRVVSTVAEARIGRSPPGVTIC